MPSDSSKSGRRRWNWSRHPSLQKNPVSVVREPYCATVLDFTRVCLRTFSGQGSFDAVEFGTTDRMCNCMGR
jgi:hypothetical protein